MDKDHSDNEFNALKLLYQHNVDDSQASNVSFNTIQDLEQHLLENEPEIVALLKEREEENKQKLETSTSSNDDKTKITTSAVGKVRPELEPTKKRRVKTVLTKLEKNDYQGPLAFLCRCVEEKLKVKIWIRSRAKIRSTMTCFIVAFDKHWNLAVTDVDELYYKKKSLFVMRNKGAATSDISTNNDVIDSLGYVSVTKDLNNYELLQRHVSQLFVKGDNIVTISILRI